MSKLACLVFPVVLGFLSATAQGQTVNASKPVDLKSKSCTELIQCFSSPDWCGADSRWDIADVLGKRENKAFLLSEYRERRDEAQRLGIIYALYRINDPEVAAFFKRLVAERFDDGEELYYPLNYLAKRCDTNALRILSGDGHGGYKGYPGCMQWGTTVELFGKCKYRPAIPYVIDSINAACMNIGIAAVEDLRKMYRGSPDFKHYSLEGIEQYFRHRAAAEFTEKR